MRSTIDYMGEQLSNHTDQHLARLAALEEETFTQLRAVNDATARQALLLQESLPKLVVGLDKAASLVVAATQGMESVSSSLAGAATDIVETSTTLARMLADAIGTMDVLAGKTTSAAQSLAEQQGAATELTEKTVAAAELLQQAAGLLSGGFDGMQSTQDAFLAGLHRQLVKHTEAMSGSLAIYADDVKKQTAHRMGEWNTQTERFTSTMLNATQALSDAIDELGVQRTADDLSSVA